MATERSLLRDALNRSRTDSIPGGVSWWFKQDEIAQATRTRSTHDYPKMTESDRMKCRQIWPLAARTMNPSVNFPRTKLDGSVQLLLGHGLITRIGGKNSHG